MPLIGIFGYSSTFQSRVYGPIGGLIRIKELSPMSTLAYCNYLVYD